MLLTGQEIVNRGIVTDLINSDLQIQPSGVDLTVNKIESFGGYGIIDFDNFNRILPKTIPVNCDYRGQWDLDQGCYLITLNEVVQVPKDYTGFAKTRSSLLRAGVSVQSSLWDPGYNGRSQVLLVVHNYDGLVLLPNARILQICFVKMKQEAEKLYSGIYNGENLR